MEQKELDSLLKVFLTLKSESEKVQKKILSIDAENNVAKDNLKKLHEEAKELGVDCNSIDAEIEKLSHSIKEQMKNKKLELDQLKENIKKYHEEVKQNGS